MQQAKRFNVIIKDTRVKGYNLYSLLYVYLIRAQHKCVIRKYPRGIQVAFSSPFNVQHLESILSKVAKLHVKTMWYSPDTCTFKVS